MALKFGSGATLVAANIRRSTGTQLNPRRIKSLTGLITNQENAICQRYEFASTWVQKIQRKCYSTSKKQQEGNKGNASLPEEPVIGTKSAAKRSVQSKYKQAEQDKESAHIRSTSNNLHGAEPRMTFFSPIASTRSSFTQILQHCDRAIVLSRDSSDIQSLWSTREELFTATRHYNEVVRSLSLKSDLDVLAYETYLIRSGYAHVIRTIGALIGQDGVVICASLMKDYLKWESDLVRTGFRSSDGSARWNQERRTRLLKMDKNHTQEYKKEIEMSQDEEILLRSGPFLQDMVPIIYDIFSDLTSYPKYTHSTTQQYIRSFSQEEHRKFASELRHLIRQLPAKSWTQPHSVDWNRFRSPTTHAFEDYSSVINACMVMEARAQSHIGQYTAAFEIWSAEMEYWKSYKKHVQHLFVIVSNSFRKSVRVVHRSLMQDGQLVDGSIGAEINALASLFIVTCKTLSEEAGFHLRISRSSWDTFDLTTIFRCLFASISLFEDQRISKILENERMEELVNSTRAFRAWLERCVLNEEGASDVRLPRRLNINTYNLILDRFMRRSDLFGETSFDTALALIKQMLTVDKIPSPDNVSGTILIKNASRMKDNRILNAALVASYAMLKEEKRKKGIREVMSERTKAFSALLQDAVEGNDMYRIAALLDTARLLRPQISRGTHTQSENVKYPLEGANISAKQAILIVYPSIRFSGYKKNWRRRRDLYNRLGSGKQMDLYKTKLTKMRQIHLPAGHARKSKYQPLVLGSALHLAARKGFTGLAEELWRLWLRVMRSQQDKIESSLTSNNLTPQQQHYDFRDTSNMKNKYQSISVLTILIRLYRREITIASRRRHRMICLNGKVKSTFRFNRRDHDRIQLDRIQSKSFVRGWARIFTGPIAHKPHTSGGTGKTDRAMAARKMTQIRYLQLRSLWIDKGGTGDLNAEELSLLSRPLQIPVEQIDPLIRPDRQFYRVLLSVFRQDGKNRMRFAENLLQNDKELIDFLHLVLNDMRAFQIEPPIEFHSLISKYTQS